MNFTFFETAHTLFACQIPLFAAAECAPNGPNRLKTIIHTVNVVAMNALIWGLTAASGAISTAALVGGAVITVLELSLCLEQALSNYDNFRYKKICTIAFTAAKIAIVTLAIIAAAVDGGLGAVISVAAPIAFVCFMRYLGRKAKAQAEEDKKAREKAREEFFRNFRESQERAFPPFFHTVEMSLEQRRNKNLAILGLEPGASQETVKATWKQLALKSHPDRLCKQDPTLRRRDNESESDYKKRIQSYTDEFTRLKTAAEELLAA